MVKKPKPINPARVMAAGFMGLILIGSFLLSMPSANVTGDICYLDAFFTATSAVCVTGLVVVDTGTYFTTFGQTIIMILIFSGSLGFMTMTTLIFIFLGRRITLRDRLLVREALNQESFSGLIPLVKTVGMIAILIIMAGTTIMSIRYVPNYGLTKGLFHSLFHAISAFGNAGFDLNGAYKSLTGKPDDYLVNGTIMLLFVLGGLGFTVLIDLINNIGFKMKLTLHSRLVLISTGMLLGFGTAVIYVLEHSNPDTLASLPLGASIFTSLFTAATPRTAGFSVFDSSLLTNSTLLILMALMFIGASPSSTGGGIKTTTFGVLLIALRSTIRGEKEQVIMHRRLDHDQTMKAISIICAAIALVFGSTLMLTIFEDKEFVDLLFESFSAFGTVGLSTGITPGLSAPSKVVLILTMFGGRIGPLTLLVALTRKKVAESAIHYPEEHIIIG